MNARAPHRAWLHYQEHRARMEPHMPALIEAVCDLHEVDLDTFLHARRLPGPRKTWAEYRAQLEDPRPAPPTRARNARWSACYVLREAGLSMPGIGALVGLDHSSVLYALRRIEEESDLLEATQPLVDRFARTKPLDRALPHGCTVAS